VLQRLLARRPQTARLRVLLRQTPALLLARIAAERR